MKATANTAGSAVEEARTRTDLTWKGVYTVGGIGMLLAGLVYIVSAVLSIVIGPPPSGGEPYLQGLTNHALVAQVNFGLWVLADLLLLPATMALYLVLKQFAKNAMLIAAGLMVLFAILDLGVTELNSLTLVALTHQYAAAASDAQRAAYVAAADYALATLPIATFFSYLVSSVGLLIISIVMLRGVFSKPAAYAGMVAGVAGIVGGFYVLLPALALFLVPSLIAFGLWSLLAGARLCALH